MSDNRKSFSRSEPNPPPEGKVASQREALETLKGQLERIAAMHPNDQPKFASGVRPFGSGDLKYFIGALSAALASPTEQASDVSGLVEALTSQRERFDGRTGVDPLYAAGYTEALEEALSQAQQVKP